MSDHSSVLDLSNLRRMEAECQALLLLDPMDGNARIQMAWSLFLQALQISMQAGVEQIAVRLLLQDSLLHAALLTQLISPDFCRQEVSRLRALIQALGGDEIVADVDRKASDCLHHLYQDIYLSRRPA